MRRSSFRWAASAAAVFAALALQAGGGGVAAAAPDSSHGAPHDDPAAAQLAEDYGIPYDEALRRVNRQDAVGALSQALSARLPEKFGQLWTDHANGGVVVVNTTAPDQRFDRAVREAGLEGQVRYAQARFSSRELSAAFADLEQSLESVQEPGSYLGLSLDARNNRVTVDSAPGRALTPAQQAWYDDARARYGDLLGRDEVSPGQPTACAWPTCDPPLRGGLWINATTDSSSHRFCTSGFNVRSKSDGKYFLLTAGHCMNSGLTWYERFVSDGTWHKIGSRWNGYYGSKGDAAIVTVDNVSGWAPRGWVYVRPSGGAYPTTENEAYPIKYTGTANQDDYVCHTGATIGTRCGQVRAASTSTTYNDGTTVGNLARVAYTSCQGDSGGPVYRANTAFGIHSGATQDAGTVVGPNGGAQQCGFTSWYGLINPIMSNLNVGVLAG